MFREAANTGAGAQDGTRKLVELKPVAKLADLVRASFLMEHQNAGGYILRTKYV
jgi:ABC-type polysaccharide/polyol phosphate export permease